MPDLIRHPEGIDPDSMDRLNKEEEKMKKRILGLMFGFLFIGANLFAADGDLIVNGNVGVGYTNPGSSWANEKLGVMNTSAGTRTTAINLINNSTSTNTAVSLDFTPNTNIPLARIRAVRSNTGGGGTTDFVFSQYKGSAGALQDYVLIKGDSGNVGIGTVSPGAKLHIVSNGGTQLTLDSTLNNQSAQIIFSEAGVGNNWVMGKGSSDEFGLYDAALQKHTIYAAPNGNFFFFPNGGGNVGIGSWNANFQLQLSTNLAAKTSTNTWIVASDSRLKTDIQPYTKGLKEILQINPVNYNGCSLLKKHFAISNYLKSF